MARNRYVVCYDVTDTPRRNRMHKILLGYGDPVQYSVFMCDLSGAELMYMRQDLVGVMNMNEDRLMVVDTGRNGDKRIFSMGVVDKPGRMSCIVI